MTRRFAWFLAVLIPGLALADTVEVSQLDLSKVRQDSGQAMVDQSVGGQPMSLGGTPFAHGVGTRAFSVMWIDLGGRATRFTATIGIDDEIKASTKARVEFIVAGDHKTLYTSARVQAGGAPKKIDLDVTGVRTLILEVSSASRSMDNCHGDWADATITYTGAAPVTVLPPEEKAEILTPPAPGRPRINGAKIVGVRPGHPLLFTIAATGLRPMAFAADGLPDGISLDYATGHLTGSVAAAGTYVVHLTATNSLGGDHRDLRIVVGDTIALTPPMGWNSWNCFARAVSDAKVRAAADAMVGSGLINHGWTYINIDDCWEVPATQPSDQRRQADGTINTNEKFPDMKALADYIHSKGLRCGLYSSPGPSTCGGFTASYTFEEKDAEQYAKWGFDYLKYDWCSYSRIAGQIANGDNPPTALEIAQHPYALMGGILQKQDRDIVFSLCQYGNQNVWEWGESIGGNSWRTTGDISDNWSSLSGIGFNQNGHEKFAGPGHWNDPDMLVVGKVGWGPALHPTHLTPNEQYTHISLWCLLSSPLLIGCDMTQLDDFTVSLLTNDEVLAINQDPLGKPAGRVSASDEGIEIWARDLEDGTKAVGLFNRGEMPNTATVNWADLKLSGSQAVRDLWRQKDLGSFDDHFSVEVPRHGVVLIKVGTGKAG